MKIRYADRKRFRVGTAKIAKKVGIAAANVLKITLFDKSDGYRLNLTVGHGHGAVGYRGYCRVVGDYDEGLVEAVAQRRYDGSYLVAVARVERAGGLVGEHHPRAVDQGPGYGYPLFLAPGKL